MRYAQRILHELKNARKDNNDEIFLKAQEDNYRIWHGMIKAPDNTPFEGHYYEIGIELPDAYPIEPPKAHFVTPIFHPNIKFKNGEICLDILKTEWTPAWSIQSMCNAIRILMSQPVADSPLNTLAGNLLRINDNVGYWSMASMYARKFAPVKNTFYEESNQKKRKELK